MAITSVGYDGPIDEVGFAQMISSVGAAEYGVVGAGDWKVSAHPSTAQAVNVASGKGWGHGVFDDSDSTVTVQCAAISSGTRWDLITARRNWQPVNGTTVFSSVGGGATKELPARLTQPGVQDEQPLALVQWTAGQTQPTAIVDLRVWAGNGGMFAKDNLVRTYLAKIGTEVTIGGVTWRLAIGANDTVGWAKVSEVGAVPVFGVHGELNGGRPPEGTSFLIQSGTFVNTTDGSGYSRLTFPKPFPNGLLSIMATNGDDWALQSGGTTIAASGNPAHGASALGTRTDWVYVVHGFANGNNDGPVIRKANMSHRINYVAIGW